MLDGSESKEKESSGDLSDSVGGDKDSDTEGVLCFPEKRVSV